MPQDTAILDTSAPACISRADARSRPMLQNHPWSLLLDHGSLEVHRHVAEGAGTAVAHGRDCAYVVMSGTGTLVRDGFDFAFGAGDLLFVPANLESSFTGVSTDFEAYALLYGPEGGEPVGQHAQVPPQTPLP